MACAFTAGPELSWVDTHRPGTLDALTFHPGLTARLRRLVAAGNQLPHLLVYGPRGSGKKTRILAFLQALFGPALTAGPVVLETRKFAVGPEASVDVPLVVSPCHVEVCVTDAGAHDQAVIQALLETACAGSAHSQLAALAAWGDRPETTPEHAPGEVPAAAPLSFRVVVLSDADAMSKDAQHALRRTMEKHANKCRVVLCCTSPSRLIDPVRSRCLGIRVPAPGLRDMVEALQHVGGTQGVAVPRALALRIAVNAAGNVRRAVHALQDACGRAAGSGEALHGTMPLGLPQWLVCVGSVVADILREQSPGSLAAARPKLRALVVNCVPPAAILGALATELVRRVEDPDTCRQLVAWAAHYVRARGRGCGALRGCHCDVFVWRAWSVCLRRTTAWPWATSQSTTWRRLWPRPWPCAARACAENSRGNE
jgi:replication factor C subunit 3/5